MSRATESFVTRLIHISLLLGACVLHAAWAETLLAQIDPWCSDANQVYYPTVQDDEDCESVRRIEFVPGTGGEPGFYRWVHEPTAGGTLFRSSAWWEMVSPENFHETGDHSEFYFIANKFRNQSNPKVPQGYPLGVNLMSTPPVGDFLPPSPTLGGGSVALLPPGSSTRSAWWDEMGRPTIDERVDLITGLPLISTQDLSIPFGGATFRLNRTRSANHPTGRPLGTGMNGSQEWWDWAGEGWMISENPLLVIDSKVPDLVGNRPKTCWLWLDAHHSIPFQYIESNDQYAAPPRFRARMEHNGDRASGIEPTQFEVWLYDGQLKYTFVVTHDDMPPNYMWDPDDDGTPGIINPPARGTTDWHHKPYTPDEVFDAQGGSSGWHNPWEPTHNPGFGVPKMALCVKVEDRYGHVVETTYHESSSTAQAIDVDGDDCDECSQETRRKGLIKSITLTTDGVTNWTLVYRHRLIWRGLDEADITPLHWADPDAYREAFAEPVIDRIYVFEHDENGNGITSSQIESLSDDLIVLEESLEALAVSDIDVPAPLDDFGQGPLPGIAATWASVEPDLRHVVSYHYKLHDMDDPAPGPLLTKVRTVTIDPELSDRKTESKLFVYSNPKYIQDHDPAGNVINTLRDIAWLECVFTSDDLRRFISVKSQDNSQIPSAMTVNHLALWWDPADPGEPLDESDQYPELAELLRGLSSRRFDPGLYKFAAVPPYEANWPASGAQSGTWDAPSPYGLALSPANAQSTYLSALGSGFGGGGVTARNDSNWSTVGAMSAQDRAGNARHYRFHRLMVMPDSVIGRYGYKNWADNSLDVTNLDYYSFPGTWHTSAPDEAGGMDFIHASVFVNPYYYRSYEQTPDDDLVSVGDLTKPRWISIIDEFKSREAMMDESESYGGPNLIKEGQLSRRVVEMNAFGYILRDRTWTYSDDGYIMDGGGLGEEYAYLTVEDYLEKINYTIPGWLSDGQGGISDDPDLRPLLDEVVLVEHRSVGWSAAAYDSSLSLDPASNGIVRFIEYDLFGGTYSFDEIPLSVRIQRTAEGIKKGTYYTGTSFVRDSQSEPLLYTRQYFRDPGRPGDIVADIAFSGETGATDLLQSIPALDQSPDPGITMTRVFSAYDNDTSVDSYLDQKLLARMVVAPPRQVRPGSEWFYPLEVELYDSSGQAEWTATGQLSHPVMDPAGDGYVNLITNPPSRANGKNQSEHNSLTWTYYHRNSYGMSDWTLLDTAGEQTIYLHSHGGPRYTPPIAYGWQRFPEVVPGAEEPSNFLTEFKYSGFSLSDTYYPNGHRWARRTYGIDTDLDRFDDVVYEFILNDLVPERDANGVTGLWFATSPGQYKRYKGENTFGIPEVDKKVRFPGTLDIDDRDFAENLANAIIASEDETDPDPPEPPYELMAEVLFAIDANGRLQRAEMMDFDPLGRPMAIGYTEVNDLGELYRERGIDGTIRTSIRNALGQTLRRYEGTADYDWFGNPDNLYGDNMVMKERVEYGLGVNNAWLPIATYRYEYVPSWDAGGYDVHFNKPPASDPDGIPTLNSYDWRMRPVMTQQLKHPSSSGETILSTSVTYLDHADRPILEVGFGAGDPVLGTLDPSTFGPTSDMPEPEDFFGLALRPTSLVMNRYGPDGTLIERRTYDTSWDSTGTLGYISEITLNGLGGQVVYNQVSGSPADVTRIDNLGREVQAARVVPGTIDASTDGYELSRTDNVYDADGNILEVHTWERVISDANPVLDETNAVRSRSVNWYDEKKRLIASANLGTEDDGNQYLNADANDTLYNYRQHLPPHYIPATGTLNRADLPPEAQLHIYVYGDGNPYTPPTEDDEQMGYVVAPNGSVTQYEYTGTGQVWREIENVTALDESQRRCTQYEYRYGKVQQIIAYEAYPNPPPDNDGPDNKGDGYIDGVEFQQTIVAYDDSNDGNGVDPNNTDGNYGAQIIDETFSEEVSRNGSLVVAAHLPDPATGTVSSSTLSSTAFYRLRYYFDGQIAERIDALNRSFRYFYDDLGRLERIDVGHYPNDPHDFSDYVAGYPNTTSVPADRVVSVHYAYDDRHQLVSVRADGVDGQGAHTIAHNTYEHNFRGSIETEYQQHGQVVHSASPFVAYAWAYQPTLFTQATVPDLQVQEVVHPGYDRLTSITYPVPDQAQTPRVMTFGYGSTNSNTDLMSWLETMASNLGTTNTATFTYLGTGRRSDALFAGGEIDWSLKTGIGVGLDALDAFGRVAVNSYARPNGSILSRGSHTYDVSGNRLTSRLIQATSSGPGSTDRDRINTYNALNQLTSTTVGQASLNASSEWEIVSPIREDDWELDVLGNWTGTRDANGDPLQPGRRIYGQLDDEDPSPGFWTWGTDPGTPDTLEFFHDHDQRNQLTDYSILLDTQGTASQGAVYDAAGNLREDGTYRYHYDAWNRLVQIDRLSNGKMLRHYTYDGLGRLIKTTSPDNFNNRIEHHFYDGVRRIQTLVVGDLMSGGGAMASGDPGMQQMAMDAEPEGESTEPDNTNMAFEEGQMQASNQTFTIYREYVWGPGDRGVDECILYTDQFGDEWWCLTDLTGDLIAVCDLDGPGGIARVCAQWTYDAYGGVMSADHLHAFSVPKFGHKGLFVDRIDAYATTIPQLIPFAHTVYHNRNRAYIPMLGRFLQIDPNQSAQALIAASPYHGRGAGAIAVAFSLDGLFGDGANLYQYLGSNPWMRSDPAGLSWDPFSIVDDYLAEDAGSKAAFMERIVGGSHTVAYLATYIASWVPIPVVALPAAGLNALLGVPDSLADNEVWQSIDRASILAGKVMLARIFGKLTIAAVRSGAQYRGSVPGSKISSTGIAGQSKIGNTGVVGEDYLRLLGGRSQVCIRTPLGLRHIDQLIGTVAHESKVGRMKFDVKIQRQVSKDRALLQGLGRGAQVNAVAWHFFRSPVTGKIGPVPELRAALQRAGITVIEHVNLP